MSGTSPMHDLNLLLMDWDKALRRQEEVNVRAARAEAEYRRVRAVELTEAKFTDSKVSLGLAEAIADADETVAAALQERLVCAAEAEALKSRLQWYRAKADAGRSQVANDRAAAQLYATHGRDT